MRYLVCISLGCGLLAGCEAMPSQIDGAHQSIVEGRLSDRRGVLSLNNQLADGFCTGSLISRRVVLTAKHCVQRPGADGPDAPEQYEVQTGPDRNTPIAVFEVEAIRTTPGIYTSQTTDRDGTLFGVDIGLLLLKTPVPEDTMPVRLDEASDQLGEALLAVGYGLTETGGDGFRREVRLEVTRIEDDRIFTGPVVCLGDSGGPLLQVDTGAIIGVTSYGEGACGSGTAAFNTLHRQRALIEDAIAEANRCVGDDECANEEICFVKNGLGTCTPPQMSLDAAVDAVVGDAEAPDTDQPDGGGNVLPLQSTSVAGGACRLAPMQRLRSNPGPGFLVLGLLWIRCWRRRSLTDK